ncbi:MAG: SpaA isopeptide-forming pilin-related protein, partial [Oscillospiraceae bacterium]
IWVASPPASFTATFRAAQDLVSDAYFYAPVGGKTASQYMAGVWSGNAKLEKVETFSGTAVLDGGIRILKFDSASNVPLAGVTFSVATDKAFSQNLRFCVTDSNGIATVDSLASGTYYVREDKPLAGYIPGEGYSTVTVANNTIRLTIKNTRYSTLVIEKIDEQAGAPLTGAKFNIYKGVGTAGTLLFADVPVNDLGILRQEKLLPGSYTIVETTPPAGYQKNPTPQTITLVAGQTSTIRIVNRLIDITTTGKLHIIKRDTDTKEQLAGAEFSVYSDRALTQLVASGIVSKANAPAELAGLTPGAYYVKETKVPTGYTLSTEVQTVMIEANKTATIHFYNEKIIATAGNYGTLL